MYNDTLPQLSTGSSELDIAQMGLSALVVAASLNRAVYVRYHEATERCEVLVQVGMDEDRRQPVRVPFTGELAWGRDDGIVWRAIRGGRTPSITSVSCSRISSNFAATVCIALPRASPRPTTPARASR